LINAINQAIADIKKNKPLILCLTNAVTMDFMANGLLALGAAPIMSCDDSELEELILISNAINLNIGTLDNAFITRCSLAASIAKRHNKPIILDPVGAGASLIRTQTARQLMTSADIIRGNASEIIALIDNQISPAGVESNHSTSVAKESADKLAKKLHCTVIVSGEEDYVTDGQRQQSLTFGSSIMPIVTGMGCTLTAVVAAFRAVVPDSFNTAYLATAYFGLCGTLTERKTKLPGAFRTTFIDMLYTAELESL